MPITPRALSDFWVGILWVALRAVWQEGPANRPCEAGNAWQLPQHCRAAHPEPAACRWPPAPHLGSGGRGRNTETLSSELSFNGVNDPFPSPSDPREIRGVLRVHTRHRRLARRDKRSVMVPFSSSTSLAFGGATACFTCRNDALYLCWGEHFRYIFLLKRI